VQIRKIEELESPRWIFAKVLWIRPSRTRSNGSIIAFVPDPEARRGEVNRNEANRSEVKRINPKCLYSELFQRFSVTRSSVLGGFPAYVDAITC